MEFSGEHATLPKAELISVLTGEMVDYTILNEYDGGRTIFLDVSTKESGFLNRLSFTKDVSEIIDVSKSPDDFSESLYERVKDYDTFRARCESKMLENTLGKILHDKGMTVNLRNPDIQVTCKKISNDYYAGIYISRERKYSFRRPQHRPFFHPTSMHPKLARALVNLAEVNGKSTILDPFCGTGGILIEAGLMGMNIIGRDIDKKMVAGCKTNLGHYGLIGDLEVSDIHDLTEIRADAIITDPPYGRSSYKSTNSVEGLYKAVIEKSRQILLHGNRLVLTLPSGYKPDFIGFRSLDSFDIRVHKSLTRRIHVLEAI